MDTSIVLGSSLPRCLCVPQGFDYSQVTAVPLHMAPAPVPHGADELGKSAPPYTSAAPGTKIHLLVCLWGSEELDLVSPGKESEEDEEGDKGQGTEAERGLLSNGIVTGSGWKCTEQNPSSKAHSSPEPKTESRSLGIYEQG